MAVVVTLNLILPAVLVLATLAWGWRNGTLRESEQDAIDATFVEIVRPLITLDNG